MCSLTGDHHERTLTLSGDLREVRVRTLSDWQCCTRVLIAIISYDGRAREESWTDESDREAKRKKPIGRLGTRRVGHPRMRVPLVLSFIDTVLSYHSEK